MKRMKPEKKRAIVGFIAVVLIAAMVVGLVSPFFAYADDSASSDFTIKAEIGFDGKEKAGNMTPFFVEIKNNSGKDFTGEIQIPIEKNYFGSYGNDKLYNIVAKDLNVPKSSSTYVELNAVTEQSRFDLNITDKNGKIVQTEKINISVSKSDDIWAALLSAENQDISYLNPKFFNYSGDAFQFDSSDFPSNIALLSNFEFIVMNDFNTESLTEQKRQCLYEWINKGGTLIIGKAFNSDDYLKGLSGIIKDDFYEGVNKLGLGKVVLYDLDLSDRNVTNTYYNVQEEINSLYKEKSDINSYSSGDFFGSSLYSFTNRLPNFSDNVIKFIFLLIYLYIIVIGPVLYLYLKKKDKREYAIAIIPTIGIAFTFSIYLLSLNTAYKKPIANIISYINLNSVYNSKVNADISINHFSPYNGKITVNTDNSFYIQNVVTNGGNDYIQNVTGNDTYICKIKTGQNNEITYYNQMQWNSNPINFKKEIDLNGNIDFDVEVKDNQVIGKIKNNTEFDFYNVVIGVSNSYISFDSFKSGEEIELNNSNQLFIDSSRNSDFEKILTDGKRDNKENPKEAYQLELRQDIVTLILNSTNNDALKLNFIAFNSDNFSDSSITVNNKKPTQTINNVFYSDYNFSLQDFKNGEIPFGVIKADLDSYNTLNTEDIEVDIMDLTIPFESSFELPENINYHEFEIKWDIDGDTEIYNFSTKSWEKLKKLPYTENISNYISSENKIQVHAVNLNNKRISVPDISLTIK